MLTRPGSAPNHNFLHPSLSLSSSALGIVTRRMSPLGDTHPSSETSTSSSLWPSVLPLAKERSHPDESQFDLVPTWELTFSPKKIIQTGAAPRRLLYVSWITGLLGSMAPVPPVARYPPSLSSSFDYLPEDHKKIDVFVMNRSGWLPLSEEVAPGLGCGCFPSPFQLRTPVADGFHSR